MLEKLGFQQLVEETLSIKRLTRVMPVYQFVLAMVLALYVGFSRLHHLRFLEREPMLTGILKVLRLPPQCTFWRFLASLHLSVAGQILRIQQILRQRVWGAAHVELKTITLDTDTTVHTLFGHQMGGRKSYNPKNRGKKSFQPILTFLAETREYVGGELRNGRSAHRQTDRPPPGECVCRIAQRRTDVSDHAIVFVFHARLGTEPGRLPCAFRDAGSILGQRHCFARDCGMVTRRGVDAITEPSPIEEGNKHEYQGKCFVNAATPEGRARRI